MEKTYRFTLPQNKEVEITNVRVENGEVIVDVELKERFEPKDGDFLVSSFGKVFIYNGLSIHTRYGAYCGVNNCNNIDICHPLSSGWTGKKGCRYATPEEKADFLKGLEGEKHLRWNADKKCLEDIRWQPKEGELFWFVGTYLDVYSTHYVSSFSVDFSRVKVSNCFRTKQAAQKVADQIKEIFKNSKAE